jgi:autophagy-related protein 9
MFNERLNMSYPFAKNYIDQFPKRMTEQFARTIAFISGAIAAVLAVASLLEPEMFLGFEITTDRTVLFYIGVFGTVWALARGSVSEETLVFDPEYAFRNVIEYTHYCPERWEGRLHSFDVKSEFSEFYKMKLVIFLEELLGIVLCPLLLLISLPTCSDQIIDFFREFTIHVDGLGYVCSFAVFDFKKALPNSKQQPGAGDIRDDYYSTKHGKMAASFYGFLDNYVINPKTGIPGLMPTAPRHQFHPPPAFPGLNSPTLAAEMHGSRMGRSDRARSRAPGGIPQAGRTPRFGPAVPQPSPMASMLLDPHHQPSAASFGARSVHRQRTQRYQGEGDIIEESLEDGLDDSGKQHDDDDVYESGGALGESTWETSPAKLSRENSAAMGQESEGGVLGLIYQFQQAHKNNRPGGGGVV